MTEPAISQFLADTNVQWAWDSTSLGEFIRCPEAYRLTHIEGWMTRNHKVELVFGGLYHKALEDYEKKQLAGASKDDALRSVIREALAAAKGTSIDWIEDSVTGELLVHDTKRTPYTLIRAIVWYIEQFPAESDPFQTMVLPGGKLGIELSARIELDLRIPQAPEVRYVLSGHLDRVGVWNDEPWFKDRKTTKSTLNQSWFAGFDLDVQMDIYSILGRVALGVPVRGGLIDACQVAVGFNRFDRGFIRRNPEGLQESLNEMQHYMLMSSKFAAENFWPRNRKACFLCGFKRVCATRPSTRADVLKMDFVQVPKEERWNPLKPR